MQPTTMTVAARRVADGASEEIAETLAVETAVAIEFNGRSHAVMLASPADLEDFALGFALTEGIVRRADELELLEQVWAPQGVVLRIRIPVKTRLSNGPSIQAPTFSCSIQIRSTVELFSAPPMPLTWLASLRSWTSPKTAKSARCTPVLAFGT